jgi:TetR/AcrR family transcriptional regulator
MNAKNAKVSDSLHRERADRTRTSILRAAIREFSAHGLAGARTDVIAESAGVNKALLYYYFKNKQDLYEAAIEKVSGSVAEVTLAALDNKYSAGERLLRAALNHFDRILAQREFQSLMQQEMVRFRMGQSGALPLIVTKFFRPLLHQLQTTVEEGIHSGELCDAEWLQVVYSMLGANVFYFLSAPMMGLVSPHFSFDRAAIAARREAALRFLGNALFVDRAHGLRLAKRVVASMPMPQIKSVQVRGKLS